jgi:hypothetical protein
MSQCARDRMRVMTTRGRHLYAPVALALGFAFASSASAATYTPTTFDDPGNVVPSHCPADQVESDPANDCSLIEAVRAANDAAGDDTIKLAARDLAITGGYVDGDFFLDGGGVLLEDDGTTDAQVTLYRVHVHGNETYGYGGGIANRGKLTRSSGSSAPA